MLKYARKCDKCSNWVQTDFSFLTDTCWFCEKCQDDINEVESSAPILIQTQLTTLAADLYISANRNDVVDISRTIALALSVGQAEYKLSDDRMIFVKII